VPGAPGEPVPLVPDVPCKPLVPLVPAPPDPLVDMLLMAEDWVFDCDCRLFNCVVTKLKIFANFFASGSLNLARAST